MIIVTGGAGFIGSAVVRTLNDNGIYDIIIVDNINTTEKWKNIRNKKYISYIHKSNFLNELENGNVDGTIDAIIHLGAQSSTTEKDFDYLYNNNFEYTKSLWNYSAKHNIKFIYASSAATYGDGINGFDDNSDIDELMPLNGYGYSKQLFDLWVKHQAKVFPKTHIGLKFFNVYGPNEYCKGSMASMVFHGFNQLKENGVINLFKSYNDNYKDGEQLRDFVYVKDICSVIYYFLNNNISGLFNVGTGKARSFNDLANATINSRGGGQINYIEMPMHLKNKYQYFTKAKIDKLRNVGYDKDFYDVESGVSDYVNNYLSNDFMIY